MAKEIVLQNAIGEDLYPHTSAECVEGFVDAVEKKVLELAYSKEQTDEKLKEYPKYRATTDDDTFNSNWEEN